MGYAPAGRILPVAPVPSLVTSGRRLPAGTDWHSGIAWSTSCGRSFAMPYCPAAPTRGLQADRTLYGTQPFRIYSPIVCDLTTVDVSDAPNIASELNDIHTASALAAALWSGDGLSPDVDPMYGLPPTLRRSAVDVSGPGIMDLDDGFATLLTYYEQATGGNGGAMVHMPATLAPFALGGGSAGARVCWPEGNIYRGALQSVVVPGPGYPLGSSLPGPNGNGPRTAVGPPEQYQGNGTFSSWVYVSGPVEFEVTPTQVLPDDERDRMAFRTNKYEVWGERSAIVRFDPCSVFAVEVANPTPLAEVS